MTIRELDKVIPSQPATEGAGVKIRRSLGVGPTQRHDPFLMLDEFYSDDPNDYLAGFPSHPHRGFETVTYMLDGHMRHEDHLGNRGDLGPGDVQWMTAARGIIHSEMPQQTEGRMRGFQLWLNLPADEKMKPAAYRDIRSTEIPSVETTGGGKIRVIAGTLRKGDTETAGPIQGLTTDPYFLDLSLTPNEVFEAPIPRGHNVFLYVYEGTAGVGEQSSEAPPRAATLLGDGETISVQAGKAGAQILVLAAKPLNEPVAQYGPFVMNTREEIEQTLSDYRDGQLTADSA